MTIEQEQASHFASLNDLNEIWAYAENQFARFGIGGMYYAAMSSRYDVKENGLTATSLWKSNYNDEFFEIFGTEHTLDHCLTAAHCMQSSDVFHWNDDSQWEDATPEEIRQSHIEIDLGMCVGTTIPLNGTIPGSVGGLGIWFKEMSNDDYYKLWMAKAGEILQIANDMNNAIRHNHLNELIRPKPLSERELEYLKWVCAGYQAARVSEKMNISSSGVAQISSRVRDKLQANTMGHAVFKAMAFNLVSSL